ncbi:MAG: shikimate kinase [candidate division KSB1 bacterium]|nr:shikimate kinase [candidate division KSB1 bacterium]
MSSRPLPWNGKNVYFLGFMAVGKSRIGSAFAKKIGRPFFDTDSLIVERAGKEIAQIFAESGEEEFRRLETEVIRDVAARQNLVIALGGGAVLREENWRLIERSGITICLTAPIEVLVERIGRNQKRPLLANLTPEERRTKIAEMLAARQPFYQRAQFTFESSNSMPVSRIVSTIYDHLLVNL